MPRFHKRLYTYCLILILVLGLSVISGSTQAQSATTNQNNSTSSQTGNSRSQSTLLDEEDDEIDDLEFDDSLDDETDDEVSPGASERDTRPSWARSFLDAARFSAQYDLGLGLEPSVRVVANRPGLRLEWERLLGEHYFVRFDGLVKLMLPHDHRARALNNKDYLLETNLREFYAQTSRGRLSLKAGKQIVIWGEAEGSAVTDVISPRDQSEFLFTSLENSRRGQIMLTTDYFSTRGRWTLILNPDAQSNRYPDAGTEYAFPSLAMQPGVSVEDEPLSFALKNTEIGLRWWKNLGSTDVSIMAANLLSNDPVYKLEGLDSLGRLVFRTTYPRYYMAGMTFNHSRGNFLFKGEIAYKTGRCFTSADPFDTDRLADLDLIQAAFAMEYDANGAYRLYLEASNQYLPGWTPTISGARRNESAIVAIWSKSFLNDTLEFSYTFGLQLQDKDIFQQASFSYDINDKLNVTSELTIISPQDRLSTLGFFGDKDRLSISIKYYF